MAWYFNLKPVATLKAKSANSNDMFTIAGVTDQNITPEQAAEYVNTLLDIGGKAITVDENMARVKTEEAINNG